MAATVAMVDAIAPELAPVDDARVNQFIGFAALQIDETRWGALADLATAYLAAHMLTVSAAGGAGGIAGPVTSETVGSVSRSYGFTSSGLKGSLATTAHGREYLRLRDMIAFTPEVL